MALPYLFGLAFVGGAIELCIVVLAYVVEKKLSSCWVEIEIALVGVRKTCIKYHIAVRRCATERYKAARDFRGLVQRDPQETLRDVVRLRFASFSTIFTARSSRGSR